MMRIVPGDALPQNMFETLNGQAWPQQSTPTQAFRMLVIYRGGQCSFCQKQLSELAQKLPQFTQRNVEVIAVSMDTKERAQQTVESLQLGDLRLGYNLTKVAANKLGLYLSAAKKDTEMPIFSEPAILLISPDNTLFTIWLGSYAFPRQSLDEIITGIDFINEKGTPIRGNYRHV